MPLWQWTKINTHFEPRDLIILFSDYIVAIWNRRPEYHDSLSKVAEWEACHEFKHYLDQYRFLQGDTRSQAVIRHVERKRLLKNWFMMYGTVPKFEEDAVIFATQQTGINSNQYDQLYNNIQPWNIPGFVL